MTQVVAWIRTASVMQELVVASDSRLSGGGHWDACPKIFALDRSDCVIAFSGETIYAYPIVLQVINLINYHERLSSRALDLCHLRGHILRVINDMLKREHEKPKFDSKGPNVNFILAGYSWQMTKFYAWHIYYSNKLRKFLFKPQNTIYENLFCTIGDCNKTMRQSVYRSLEKKVDKYFDWEPLDSLNDLIQDEKINSIGGSIQMYKIYKSLNTKPSIIIQNDALHLNGRPLLSYEKPRYNLFDVETHENLTWEAAVERFPRIHEPQE
jgi:hypothetical protein